MWEWSRGSRLKVWLKKRDQCRKRRRLHGTCRLFPAAKTLLVWSVTHNGIPKERKKNAFGGEKGTKLFLTSRSSSKIKHSCNGHYVYFKKFHSKFQKKARVSNRLGTLFHFVFETLFGSPYRTINFLSGSGNACLAYRGDVRARRRNGETTKKNGSFCLCHYKPVGLRAIFTVAGPFGALGDDYDTPGTREVGYFHKSGGF